MANEKKQEKIYEHTYRNTHTWILLSGDSFLHTCTHKYDSRRKNTHTSISTFRMYSLDFFILFYFINANSIQFGPGADEVQKKHFFFHFLLFNGWSKSKEKNCQFVFCHLHTQTKYSKILNSLRMKPKLNMYLDLFLSLSLVIHRR